MENNTNNVQQENESVLSENKQVTEKKRSVGKILSVGKIIGETIISIAILVIIILIITGKLDGFFYKLGLGGKPDNDTLFSNPRYQDATGKEVYKAEDGNWYYKDNSEEKDTNNNGKKIDLYASRFATEEAIVSNFDFEYNELGMYPTENNGVISCFDGAVFMINIDENNADKYSFCGVSVGDDATDAKEKLSKFYTFLYSREPNVLNDNTIDDRYTDNKFGGLIITYYMDTNKIKNISYIAMEDEAEIINETTVETEIEIEPEVDESTHNNITIYESVLDSTTLNYGEYSDYSIVDIDKDGISELIISYGTCDADWINDVYTLFEGDMLYLGSFYNVSNLYIADNYIADGEGIIAVSGNMGIENIDQIKKQGTELIVNNIIHRELAETEDYYSNGLNVSTLPTNDKSLLYEDAELYTTQTDEDFTLIQEFASWDEYSEIYIQIMYTSDTEGYLELKEIIWNEDGSKTEETVPCIFIANEETEGFNLYDLDGNYMGYYFEITYNECAIFTLYNVETGESSSFLEKEWATNNVG